MIQLLVRYKFLPLLWCKLHHLSFPHQKSPRKRRSPQAAYLTTLEKAHNMAQQPFSYKEMRQPVTTLPNLLGFHSTLMMPHNNLLWKNMNTLSQSHTIPEQRGVLQQSQRNKLVTPLKLLIQDHRRKHDAAPNSLPQIPPRTCYLTKAEGTCHKGTGNHSMCKFAHSLHSTKKPRRRKTKIPNWPFNTGTPQDSEAHTPPTILQLLRHLKSFTSLLSTLC